MKKWGKNLFLSWIMLKRLAENHVRILIVQIITFSAISCYNVVIAPFIIAQVYQALEKEDVFHLYRVCGMGGAMLALMFLLCYLQNVYLDLNSFRISLTSNKNACKLLFNLGYGRVNRQFAEGEILNRMDSCAHCISGIFPLCASVLSKVLGIGILLVIAGRVSVVLLVLTVLAAGAGFLVTKYESSRKVRYEEKRQQAMDKTGGLLEHTISHMELFGVYGECGNAWSRYQEERDRLWQGNWKQEQAGIYASVFLEMVTSMLRGVLGLNLFNYYQKNKIDSEEVASSFSVFDQLKGTAGSFSWPISAVRTSNATIRRFEDMLQAGKKPLGESGGKNGSFICLRNVSYKVEGREILKSVCLSITKGEKVAILGANGSGKSTLMRIIAGLYQPDRGVALISSRNTGGLSDKSLRKMMSYISAQSYLYGQSAEENIRMNGIDDNNERRFREVCSLACVTEEDILGQNALELSGGQMQRVNIARGLLNPAPLLLADEPEAGLPPAQGQLVLHNILQSADTAIVITHNCDDLSAFSRVLICHDGQIVADGKPEEVVQSGTYMEWRKKNIK